MLVVNVVVVAQQSVVKMAIVVKKVSVIVRNIYKV